MDAVLEPAVGAAPAEHATGREPGRSPLSPPVDGWRATGGRAPALPSAGASCALLTAITVLTAFVPRGNAAEPVARVLYFAILFSFFHAIGRRRPELRTLPFRLVETGFLVLTSAQAAAAILRINGFDGQSRAVDTLLFALERGAFVLLGLSLVAYGIILWVPLLLEGHRVLRERYESTRGELRWSERTRARMEQRFVEAARLHAIGELAAGIAHDLRNPLAIIKATADSMGRGQRSGRDLAEHSEVIRRNIDRADRTITALLDLGKPRVPSPCAIDIDAVIAETFALVAVECRRRAIELRRCGDEGLLARGDRKLLPQVLLNLLLNALQASPEHATITVRTRRVTLASLDLTAIAVEDRGCGIDSRDRGRLFTPFFTTKAQGTGLGLLSSRRIVEDLGGHIGLFPRTGGGSRAVIVLPHPPAETAPGSDL